MSPLARTLRFSLVALAALAFAASASADDRQLLREGSGHPYVMVLLDTSGSMNWAPPCTQAQYDTFIDDDGDSGGVCPEHCRPRPRACAPATSSARRATVRCRATATTRPRSCARPRRRSTRCSRASPTSTSASPASTRTRSTSSTSSGSIRSTRPSRADSSRSPARRRFPAAGSQEVFGQSFNCSRGGGDGNIGCASTNNNPADTNDLWEMTKIRRWPKLDDNLGLDSFYYIRDSGGTYRVRVTNPVGSTQNLGDATMSLRFRVYRCNNPSNGCNATSEYTALANGDKTIQYSRIGDFVKWDYQVSRNPDQGGYDGVQYSSTSNTCNGWDPNTDSNNDDYNGYSLRYPDQRHADFRSAGNDERLALPDRRRAAAGLEQQQQDGDPEPARAASERRRSVDRPRGLRGRDLPQRPPDRRQQLPAAEEREPGPAAAQRIDAAGSDAHRHAGLVPRLQLDQLRRRGHRLEGLRRPA